MRLSAIRSVFRCTLVQAGVACLLLLTAAWAQAETCGPSPEIRSQLDQIKVVVSGPSDFDRGLAPLRALRRQHPSDLWVNQRYQDAVQQYGIEGHLRKLTEEYQVLSMQHPDELIYSYLYARSLMGRNTPSAIQQMTEIIASHPELRSGACLAGGNLLFDGVPRRVQGRGREGTLAGALSRIFSAAAPGGPARSEPAGRSG